MDLIMLMRHVKGSIGGNNLPFTIVYDFGKHRFQFKFHICYYEIEILFAIVSILSKSMQVIPELSVYHILSLPGLVGDTCLLL